MDTPANPTLEGDEENSIQDVIANICYPTHEWVGDKHIVMKVVGDPDVNAQYKILVQYKLEIALFNSGASIPLISEKFYKHFPNAVKLLKHDDTAIINAHGYNLGPISQCYLTFKLGMKTFTDKFYTLWNLDWDVILGLTWMKNYHIVFNWNINGQHYLWHNVTLGNIYLLTLTNSVPTCWPTCVPTYC